MPSPVTSPAPDVSALPPAADLSVAFVSHILISVAEEGGAGSSADEAESILQQAGERADEVTQGRRKGGFERQARKQISEDECRVRLKMWLLAGLDVDPARQDARDAHMMRIHPRSFPLLSEADVDAEARRRRPGYDAGGEGWATRWRWPAGSG